MGGVLKGTNRARPLFPHGQANWFVELEDVIAVMMALREHFHGACRPYIVARGGAASMVFWPGRQTLNSTSHTEGRTYIVVWTARGFMCRIFVTEVSGFLGSEKSCRCWCAFRPWPEVLSANINLRMTRSHALKIWADISHASGSLRLCVSSRRPWRRIRSARPRTSAPSRF